MRHAAVANAPAESVAALEDDPEPEKTEYKEVGPLCVSTHEVEGQLGTLKHYPHRETKTVDGDVEFDRLVVDCSYDALYLPTSTSDRAEVRGKNQRLPCRLGRREHLL